MDGACGLDKDHVVTTKSRKNKHKMKHTTMDIRVSTTPVLATSVLADGDP
jgi:hypothetical protein